MKKYPFFITEVIFLLIFLAVITFAVFFNGPFSWAFALMALMIFIAISFIDHQRFVDFEKSIGEIKGLDWETDFWSVGTLKFKFKGETVRYNSCIGTTKDPYIPVRYHAELENRSNVSFELNPGGRWLGEFSAKGNRKFLDTLRQEITKFNRNYALVHMSNRKGVLRLSVELDFMVNQPPPPDKLQDMSRFLVDFLEFGCKVNKKLRKK